MPTSYPSSSSGLSRFFFPTKFFGLLLNCFTSVFRKYRPVSKISLWRRSAQAFSCLDQSNLEPWAPREERPILSWQPLFQSRWRSNHVFPLQRSPNWHCIPLAVSRIQQLLQYLEHNSNNLIHRTGKQISEISWPPLFCPRETLSRIPEKTFCLKKLWGGLARSRKTGSPLPLTPRRRLHPPDRLSPILSSCCLQASCMSNPRIITTQMYLVTAWKGWQTHVWTSSNGVDRCGWPTWLDSILSVKGTSPSCGQYVTAQLRHSKMDWIGKLHHSMECILSGQNVDDPCPCVIEELS